MSEKRFYHQALERTLLSGKACKRQIDAKIRKEQSKEASYTVQNKERKEWNPHPIPWIAIPVAAMLLLSTLAIGISAGAAGLWNRARAVHPANDSPDSQTETLQMQTSSAGLQLVDLGSTVVLLPDFSEELRQECLDWRRQHLETEYRVEDWDWLKGVKPEIIGVAYDGKELSWNVKTMLPQIEPFTMVYDDEAYAGQLVEISLPQNVRISVDGGEEIVLSHSVNARNSSISSTKQFEANSYYVDADLPASGTVTVTERFYFVDYRVEDMQRYFGAVAYMEHSFSFHSAALTDQMEHCLVCLSETDSVLFLLDADITDALGTTLETFAVEKREITNEMLASFARYFAGDAPLQDDLMDTRYTKAQLKRMIEALEEGIEKGDGDAIESASDVRKEIETLEKMYETALDSYSDRNIVQPVWENWHGDPTFQAIFAKDDAWYALSGSGSAYQSYLQCFLLPEGDYSRSYVSYNADAPAPLLSEAEAINNADAIKNALAPDLLLDSVTVYANMDNTRSAYCLLYRPAVHGVVVHDTRFISGNSERELSPVETFAGDRMQIILDEKGIVSVSWQTPATISATGYESARWTVDALLNNAEQPLRRALTEKFPAASYPNCLVHIDRVALEYTIVTEMTNGEATYRMAPVWNFYGDIRSRTDESTVELFGGENTVLLTCDALDGQVLMGDALEK